MRYWLIIAVLSGISINSQAQIYLGAKIGTNLTTINYARKTGQSRYDMDMKLGYIGGLVFQQFLYSRGLALK